MPEPSRDKEIENRLIQKVIEHSGKFITGKKWNSWRSKKVIEHHGRYNRRRKNFQLWQFAETVSRVKRIAKTVSWWKKRKWTFRETSGKIYQQANEALSVAHYRNLYRCGYDENRRFENVIKHSRTFNNSTGTSMIQSTHNILHNLLSNQRSVRITIIYIYCEFNNCCVRKFCNDL